MLLHRMAETDGGQFDGLATTVLRYGDVVSIFSEGSTQGFLSTLG